jgi:hypothetical protein
MCKRIIEYPYIINLKKNSPDKIRGVLFYLSFFTKTF